LGCDVLGVPVPAAERLLEALPFRRRPRILFFDSLECPPMLSLGSLAVAPLSPVAVDDWTGWDDDFDGT
jgi:hypothetical protein